MSTAARVAIVFLLLMTPTFLRAQPEWLPADVGEAMAQEIAQKIQLIDVDGKIAPEDGLVGARKSVGAIAARIQVLGEDGILELSPVFPELDLPVSGQPHLDAMARYGLCSFPIDAVYADEMIAMEQRLTAAVMSTGLVIASAYLRHEYRAAGATDDQAKALLAGPELNAVAFKVQAREDLMQQVMSQCAEPLTELLK